MTEVTVSILGYFDLQTMENKCSRNCCSESKFTKFSFERDGASIILRSSTLTWPSIHNLIKSNTGMEHSKILNLDLLQSLSYLLDHLLLQAIKFNDSFEVAESADCLILYTRIIKNQVLQGEGGKSLMGYCISTGLQDSGMATVIEGASLATALEDSNRLLFLELCQLCRSVVCCRVSPIQKAQVTRLVKENGGAVTLAIGDGANDVQMIKVAQVGVGVGGREGMAAVLASDYSIAQFRFLTRLLLVHGRWSYKRNRDLVLYAFYKNIVYVMGNVYLAFFSGYSAQALYTAAMISSYNCIWTALPTMAFAILDKDLCDGTVENNPHLYLETQFEKRGPFFWCLVGWLITATWDSLVAFFFPLLARQNSGYLHYTYQFLSNENNLKEVR